MGSLRDNLKSLQDKGDTAVISFIMAALPDENLCLDCIRALEQGGCDVLELGVPFTDPLADGEVIERFHHRGTEQGLNLSKCLDFAGKVAKVSTMPLVLFCYYNPIYKMGWDKFVAEASSLGIQGLIVPDVPLDEMELLQCDAIEPIPMVAPSSSDERMQKAAEQDPSFIYCVSVRGVTGVRGELPEQEIREYLGRVRSFSTAPLALGFGISRPEQVKIFRGSANAVVVGSHLARTIEEYSSRPHLLPGELEKIIRGLKQAGLS
ncbi:MAG: tryptophan synthase subunit alpha [Syntrophomonadaceae bacterium]|nr:tryptophan synthase subunit alpha [Syntrophomonadaceae bacterium]